MEQPDAAVAQRITRVVAGMLANLATQEIVLDDPRFRWIRPQLPDPGAAVVTLAEMLEAVEASLGAEHIELLSDLSEYLREQESLLLEEELAAVLSPLLGRARKDYFAALLARYGWSGEAPQTLEVSAQIKGVTRERVRQVQGEITDELTRQPVWLPVLDRAVRILRRESPVRVDRVGLLLVRAGLSAIPTFDARSLVETHRLVRATPLLDLVEAADTWFVIDATREPDFSWLERARTAIIKRVNNQGITSVNAVVAAANAAEVGRVQVLEALDMNAAWQLIDGEWILSRDPDLRNPLLHRILKVLTILPEVPAELLFTQVQRDARERRRIEVSLEAIRVFARIHPALEVLPNGWIRSAVPLDPDETLSESERAIVALMANAPAEDDVSFTDIAAALEAADRSRVTASVTLANSPIVSKLGRNVYALVSLEDLAPGDLDLTTEEAVIEALASEEIFDLPEEFSPEIVGDEAAALLASDPPDAGEVVAVSDMDALAAAESSAGEADATPAEEPPVVEFEEDREAREAREAFDTVVRTAARDMIARDGGVYLPGLRKALASVSAPSGETVDTAFSRIDEIEKLHTGWFTSFDPTWKNAVMDRFRTIAEPLTGDMIDREGYPIAREAREAFAARFNRDRDRVGVDATHPQRADASPVTITVVSRAADTSTSTPSDRDGAPEARVTHPLGVHENDFPDGVKGNIQRMVARQAIVSIPGIYERYELQATRKDIDAIIADLERDGYQRLGSGAYLTIFDERYHNRLTHRLRRLLAMFENRVGIPQAIDQLCRSQDVLPTITSSQLREFVLAHPEFSIDDKKRLISGTGHYALDSLTIFQDAEREILRIFAEAGKDTLTRAHILAEVDTGASTIEYVEKQLDESVIVRALRDDRYQLVELKARTRIRKKRRQSAAPPADEAIMRSSTLASPPVSRFAAMTTSASSPATSAAIAATRSVSTEPASSVASTLGSSYLSTLQQRSLLPDVPQQAGFVLETQKAVAPSRPRPTPEAAPRVETAAPAVRPRTTLTEQPLDALIEQLSQGTLAVPVFCRAPAWDPEQVCALVDSLYRGYPLSGIVAWETEAWVRIRDSRSEAPQRYLLDGQRRLLSLARVQQTIVPVQFDVEREEFVVHGNPSEDARALVNVGEVLRSDVVRPDLWLPKLASAPDAAIFTARLERLRTILATRVPIWTLTSMTKDEMLEVLRRMRLAENVPGTTFA